MTKDGRPSRITDIRLFHGNKYSYLKDHEDAVAFGRRIAWFLNGEGFSLGAYPQLYLFFTPTITSGAIQVTDYGGDWWQRYTHIGVPPEFPDHLDASGQVTRGTVAALKTIRPDLATMIEYAEQMVTDHSENLRFLLKSRQTKEFTVDVSFNIAIWPQPSHMFISLTNRSNGTFLEATPIPLLFYDQAFDLAGAIKVSRTAVDILPHKSVGARLTAARHGDVHRMVSEFLPGNRPVFSKLVKRVG
jgi:hypothetical protein